MLDISLDPDAEERLARHARDTGRATSVVARDWIMERLEREDVDTLIRNWSELPDDDRERIATQAWDDATSAWLRALDAEDGGYDWGPDGPPTA